jgi:hypothetical protein
MYLLHNELPFTHTLITPQITDANLDRGGIPVTLEIRSLAGFRLVHRWGAGGEKKTGTNMPV